jgi:hypothetical protein
MSKKAMVICGFPGVGKTSVANNRENILDAESSVFSWIWNPENLEKGRERNPEFPNNYIRYIKENMDRYDVILVASHQKVRDAMKMAGIQYLIVAPMDHLKNEYLIRYLRRGSDIDFIELLNDKWYDFMRDIMNDDAPTIRLKPGENLSDILGEIAR